MAAPTDWSMEHKMTAATRSVYIRCREVLAEVTREIEQQSWSEEALNSLEITVKIFSRMLV